MSSRSTRRKKKRPSFSAPSHREREKKNFVFFPPLSASTLALFLSFSLRPRKALDFLCAPVSQKKRRKTAETMRKKKPKKNQSNQSPCRPEDRQPNAEADAERGPVVRADVPEHESEVVPVDERRGGCPHVERGRVRVVRERRSCCHFFFLQRKRKKVTHSFFFCFIFFFLVERQNRSTSFKSREKKKKKTSTTKHLATSAWISEHISVPLRSFCVFSLQKKRNKF